MVYLNVYITEMWSFRPVNCLHKAASLPEKSEEVRFYFIGNNLRSCIAFNYQKQKTRGLKQPYIV